MQLLGPKNNLNSHLFQI